MARIYLGGYGKTILSLLPGKGLEGDSVVLQQMDGSMRLGVIEIQAIAALAAALSIETHPQTIAYMKEIFAEHGETDV